MKVKTELKYCLLTYPSLFVSTWDVYHHWFCVNGNGYEWVKGQLVDICGGKECKTVEQALEKVQRRYTKQTEEQKEFLAKFKDEPKIYNKLKAIYGNDLETYSDRVRNWKQISETLGEPTRENGKIYPLCEYAKILNIPEDIKPDWKQAAKEMYDWLVEHPDWTSETDKKYIKQIKL